MCCLAPIVKLFSLLLVSICACFGFSSSATNQGSGYKRANMQYGNNNDYNNRYQQDELVTAPIYQQDDIIVTDAYFVSPLVSAQVMTGHEETVILGQVHESKEEIQSVEEKFQFKDVWFAILFLINFIIVIVLSVREAIVIYRADHMSSNDIEKNVSSYTYKAEPVIVSCLVLGTIATFIGALWLNILMNYSDYLIRGVMIVNIFISALASLTFFLHGNLFFGIIFTIFMMILRIKLMDFLVLIINYIILECTI
jgi:hypothetical protein